MKQAYLGCDVSKGRGDFLIKDDQGVIILDFKHLYDHKEDHDELITILRRVQSDGYELIHCGFESTAGYENNWIRLLLNQAQINLQVYRLNPIRVANQSRASMKRTITDRMAAESIVDHVMQYNRDLKPVVPDSEQFRNARSILKHIDILNKQNTQCVNSLRLLIYSHMPELSAYTKNAFPMWLTRLLAKHSCREDILKRAPSTLSKIKGLSIEKATTIKNKLKISVGSKPDMSTTFLIEELSTRIIELEASLKRSKDKLVEVYENSDIGILSSIGGIGDYLSICALIEIEDVNRFSSAKKMASFFGVHPVFKESGDSKGKSRMSKKGSSTYRSNIYMAAHNVCIHEPYFVALKEMYKKNGRTYDDIMGIVMHKLTRIFYGMLKNNTAFKESVIMTQHKSTQKQESKEEIQEQIKYLEKELNKADSAPVSQRHRNGIRKKLESQVRLLTNCGITQPVNKGKQKVEV